MARARSTVMAAGGAARTGVGRISKGVSTLVKNQQTAMAESANRALEDYLPSLRNIVSDHLPKMLRSAESALKDEVFLKNLFGAVYDCLPKPVRRLVPEASFVEFCLKHRHRLLD